MAARRPRKTERGIKDFDTLLEAIKAIKINNKSRKSTSKAYNIDMRSLGRYVSKFNAAVPDITAVTDNEMLKVVRQIASYSTPSLVFNEEQEKALVEYVIKCAKQYYGLSIKELKQLAYQFAQKINAEYPRSWDAYKMAGKQWYYGFMQRHKKLSLRTPVQTSLNRVKAFCRENVNHFFQNLKSIFDVQPFTSSSIWNMEETGFSTVPSQMGKIISVKGENRDAQITSCQRGNMLTMAFAVSASGNSLPPFYIFPTKTMNPLYLTHASNDSIGCANYSGWMQQAEFVKFMEHFIKYSHSSTSSPTLLLLDNHGSHLSVKAIDIAAENGVTMLSFPPHCSHRLQPLDVSVYGPVKCAYNRAHNTWIHNNAGKTLDMAVIPMLIATALQQGATTENIVAGFSTTGICPYDPGVFNDSHFFSLSVDKADTESSAVEIDYDANEQRRIVVDSAQMDLAPSEPSSSNISVACSLTSTISSIKPLREAKPQKKLKKTVLSAPENVAVFKEQQKKRAAAKEKKEASAKKKQRKASPQSNTTESTKNDCQQKE